VGKKKEEIKLLVLGIDTATRTCSVALLEDDSILAEYTQNLPRTHSEKLMPLVNALFHDTSRTPRELDALAVASGPGSFTGLRIGVSTARAMAQGLGIPAAGINTLEALARNCYAPGSLVCPLMDARRQQVYAAVYKWSGNPEKLAPVVEPAAFFLEELLDLLQDYSQPVLFPGDGAPVYRETLQNALPERYWDLPAPLASPRASQVAWCARGKLLRGERFFSYLELKPEYLRASEAERKHGSQVSGR